MLARPASFGYNSQTALDNKFQKQDQSSPKKEISSKALNEWQAYADTLNKLGIEVVIYEDTEAPEKPDAVFCRDWNSFHEDGTVILYPLKCKNRRIERRRDVIEKISSKFHLKKVYDDLCKEEDNGKYLEGSGAIVFDYANKRMYVCLSERTNVDLIQQVAENLGFTPYVFETKDQNGHSIYHADVVMSVGSNWAIVCEDSFPNKKELDSVKNSLTETNHEIVTISYDQMNCFSANCYEVMNSRGDKYIIMSETGVKSLTENQKETLEKYAKIVPISVQTIEANGGGSVRCMAGDIRLQKKITYI